METNLEFLSLSFRWKWVARWPKGCRIEAALFPSLESWLLLTENSWSLLESSCRTSIQFLGTGLSSEGNFSDILHHTCTSTLVFDFYLLGSYDQRPQYWSVRFTEGLQVPVTDGRFQFLMLWVLVDRDREHIVVSNCSQDSGCSPPPPPPLPSMLILSFPLL